MTYAVDRVEWKDYGGVVTQVLAGSFPGRAAAARYAWLHESNPAGPDAVWLARSADGRPVGTAAIHGRRIVVDGQAYRAGQAADFVVDPAARGFGPALALQRAVMAACDSGEFAFLYGFPNGPAQAIFQRIGYRPGKSRRLARPLRSHPYLARYRPSVARLLAMPLDRAIQLVSRETYERLPRGTRLERITAFDDWFDAFWSRVRGQHVVIADRDSQYMNWRYANWPARHYDFAVLRRGADVMATIVWYRIDDVVHVAEAFALDPRWFDALLAEFLRAHRRAGVSAVSLISLGDGGPADRLGKYGFFGREVERSMVLYVPSPSSLCGGVLDCVDRWSLFEGDIL